MPAPNCDQRALGYVSRFGMDGYREFLQAGISSDHLDQDFQNAWGFIQRMHRDHNTVPSPEMLETRYDNLDLPKVKRTDLPVILRDLKLRYKYVQFLTTATDAASRLNDGWDSIDDVLEHTIGVFNTLLNENGSRDHLVDLFSEKTGERLLAEMEERRKQPGIPTGIVALDQVTGGFRPQRLIVLMGRAGIGKAQPLDAKVLTPTGWGTMGDMKVGSKVLCPDGSTARVTGVYDQGVQDVYRVTFSDGAYAEATGEHLWLTQTFNEGRGHKRWSTKTTNEIANSLRHHSRWNHTVPLADPIDWPEEPLPVDPYVLGVWLGDGHGRVRRNSARVAVTSSDPELIADLNDRLPHGWFRVLPSSIHRCPVYGYTDGSNRWHKAPWSLCAEFKKLGILGCRSWEKYVPEMYMRASAKSRLLLLQGLLDTDGTPSSGGQRSYGAGFSSSSEQLARQVRELVWSLGGTATYKTRRTFAHNNGQRKEGRTGHRLHIHLPEGMAYFLLQRKADRTYSGGHVRNSKQTRAARTIRSVVPSRRVEARCISIDNPSGLYITDDCVVTHNTWVDLLHLASAVLAGYKAALFSLEMTWWETATRLYTIFSALTMPQRVLKNYELSRGLITHRELKRFMAAMHERFEGRLYVADTATHSSSYTMERIAAEVKGLRPDIGWVDYLTLVHIPRGSKEGWEGVRDLSRGLKRIAVEANCVMGCSAQVNRAALQQDSPIVPRLEHIAYGDSIGQDADQVISIARKKNVLFWALVKNRHGRELGKQRLSFDPDIGSFQPMADDAMRPRRTIEVNKKNRSS